MNNLNNTSQTATAGKVAEVTDDDFVQQVLESDTPVLVDFMADWCGPCKVMGPVFANMAPEYEGKVKFLKMNVDDSPGVSSALSITNIPTFMLFYRNTVLNHGVGSMPAGGLRSWIAQGLERMSEIPEDEVTQEA